MNNFKTKIINSFLLVVVFPLILVFYSCGSGGESFVGSSGQPLRVEIDFPEEMQETPEEQTSRTLEDLDTCKIIISGGTPSITEIVREFLIDEEKRVSVPLGDGRMFTFIGQDEFGNPLCKGETTVDVNPDTSAVTISCEFVTEICTDGIDNDFDNFTDCQDPDCDRSGCSSGNASLECIGGQCMEPEPEPAPEPSPQPSQPPCPTGNIGPNGNCIPVVPVNPPGGCPPECFCDGGCFCCIDQGG